MRHIFRDMGHRDYLLNSSVIWDMGVFSFDHGCYLRCTGSQWSLVFARRAGISGPMEQGYCPAMGSCCMLSVRRRALSTGEEEDMLEDKVDDEHVAERLTQPQPVCRSMMTKPTRIFIILQRVLKMQRPSSGLSQPFACVEYHPFGLQSLDWQQPQQTVHSALSSLHSEH